MTEPTRAGREADLRSYYDAEATTRAARRPDPLRVARRAAYLQLLRREGRGSVLEVGCGPGRDGIAMVRAGLRWTGVDLSPGAVSVARERGLDARVGTALDLPFPDSSMEAGWSMSTLLHLDEAQALTALGELSRVLRPGAPLAIGLWGSDREREEVWHDGGADRPGRFFAIRSDERVRRMLSAVGTVEEFHTWRGTSELHYQWLLVRTPGE